MFDSPSRVWHCENRLSGRCNNYHRCRGTDCSAYGLKEGSFAIEEEYLKKGKREDESR